MVHISILALKKTSPAESHVPQQHFEHPHRSCVSVKLNLFLVDVHILPGCLAFNKIQEISATSQSFAMQDDLC